jgi:hypothetical protein
MKTVSGPATKIADVTLHDSTPLNPPSAALFVGTGGDVKVTAVDGGTSTFKNVASGTVLPVAATVVFSTGTTASNIVALY